MSNVAAQDIFRNPDDELDDLEEHFGDDFGFGFEEGEEYAGDPNVVPKVPIPEEVADKRSWDSVVLKWEPLRGQIVKKLQIQAMPFPPGFQEGYDSTSRGGGKTINVEKPIEDSEITFTGLKPYTEYMFRMVARNDAGRVEGTPTPISVQTLSYSPPRGDKSAWLHVMPAIKKESAVRTLGRRLSFKKTGPKRYWFVLDGALLTWYKDVDGEEVGYAHLGKLKEISFSHKDDNTTFTLHLGTGKDETVEIDAISEKPSETPRQVFESWVEAITDVRKSLGGRQTQVVRKNSMSS